MSGRGLVWIAAAAIVVGSATPAAAQATGDEWQVLVAPYLMGAAMSGTTTVRGLSVDVDISASDVFSNLQFGAMGMVVARKGRWGVGGDAIWMALGATVAETNVDVDQGAFAVYGLRQLAPAVDVTAGLRVNTLQSKLKFKRLDIERSQGSTWVDPLVGVNVHSDAARRVQARLYAEIGGFGVGSDLTWQLFPTLSVRMGAGSSLELGYRWLDLDYDSGEGLERFAYDVLTQGPVAGFAFRF